MHNAAASAPLHPALTLPHFFLPLYTHRSASTFHCMTTCCSSARPRLHWPVPVRRCWLARLRAPRRSTASHHSSWFARGCRQRMHTPRLQRQPWQQRVQAAACAAAARRCCCSTCPLRRRTTAAGWQRPASCGRVWGPHWRATCLSLPCTGAWWSPSAPRCYQAARTAARSGRCSPPMSRVSRGAHAVMQQQMELHLLHAVAGSLCSAAGKVYCCIEAGLHRAAGAHFLPCTL